ncbi:MAG TPA: hypothetical protein VFS30_13130 [Dehalococcoidia bacterium]|nr:hypothetical protein [Dehalococcoidia bacterium]
MKKIRWILAPLAAGLLALSAACGGDDDTNNQSNDGATASGGGGAVSQELNLAQAATQLMELRSFRFDLSFSLDLDLEGLGELDASDEDDEFGAAFAAAFLALFSDISMQGAYVAPDSFDMQMGIAGEDVHYIQIGTEAWVDDGSGWVVTTPDGGDLSLFGDPTSFATDLLPDEVLQNAKITDDEVDGMPAKRYHFDKASLQSLASDLGEDTADFAEIDEMELDVWLIEGDIPVKFEVKVSGTDADGLKMGLEAKFEITDINQDIKIERPIP